MNVSQALNLIDQALSTLNISRQQHMQLIEALNVVKNELNKKNESK